MSVTAFNDRREMTVRESLEAHKKVLAEFYSAPWDELTSSEKAMCMTYKKLLERGVKISSTLILEINEIHERYPDFHMGCIPCQMAMMTDDLSGYLPEGA